MMTRAEVAELVNRELFGAYPWDYEMLARNSTAADAYVSKLLESFNRNGFTAQDMKKAVAAYSEGEDGKWKPSLNDLVRYGRIEKNKRERMEGTGTRRIVTLEEELYEIYLAEMKKEPKKRNEDLLRRCLPYIEVFTDPDLYFKRYGKTREENERF